MINIEEKGDSLYVISIGIQEVHTLDVPDLKEKLQNAIAENSINKLVLDLSKVKMITSSGIGIFLNINQSLNSKLKLAAVNEEVKKVLDLTKVSSVINIFDTVDEAINSL